MPYVVIIESKEVRGASNALMTKAGDKFLVAENEGGWVEATSIQYIQGDGGFPAWAKVFATQPAAEAFTKRWTGHPWWCVPNGNYQILEVEVVTEPRVIGWREVGASEPARPS